MDNTNKAYLSDGAYDLLKRFSLYLLPALGAAYFGIAAIWGLPKAEEVVGTIVVIETLLGVIMRISKVGYDAAEPEYDGEIIITPNVEEGYDSLHLQTTPEAVLGKDVLQVKVQRKD